MTSKVSFFKQIMTNPLQAVRSMSLRLKLTLIALAIVVFGMGGITLLSVNRYTEALTNEVGDELAAVAEAQARNFGTVLAQRTRSMQVFALSEYPQAAIAAQNATYAGDKTSEAWAKLDEQWVAASEDDTLVQERLESEAADELERLTYIVPDFVEAFLTDQYGGLVAASGRTSDYYQADEEWWQAAYNGGQGAVFIAEPELDESTGVIGIDMAVPIYSDSEVIGVLRTTLDATVLLAEFQIKLGETSEIDVVYPSGKVMASGGGDMGEHEHAIDPALLARLDAAPRGHIEGIYDGVPSVVGQARVVSAGGEQYVFDLNWKVVAHQDKSEALATVRQVNRAAWGLMGLIILVTGVAAILVAQQVANPVVRLTDSVERFAAGEYDVRAPESKARDEIGTLTASFNEMADQVARLVSQVRERSEKLEERTRELEASQSVTFAASERVSPDELLGLVVDLIRDRFELYHAQVYLVDEEKQAAVLRQSTGYAGSQLLQKGHQIPLDATSLVTRAIHTAEPVLVDDTSTDPDFMPNPLLPETKSELVVPLKVGDEVIGVLDAQDMTPGRFTESTVSLFQTMSNQVAFLFENSELLERVTDQAEALTIFTTQLRTVAEIARQAGTILDPERLLNQVVELMQSRFGLYHAHIYVLDETTNNLVVNAGSGEVGRVLVEERHSIPLDREKSLVARAARTQEPVLVEDTTLESDFMPNPLLPQTRSELVVPLVVGGELLGALDMQDDQVARFSEDDLDTYAILAGQIATSLQNANLFEETEARLRVSQALAPATTEGEVLDAMVEVADFYPQAGVAILLFDSEVEDSTLVLHRHEVFDSGLTFMSEGTRFAASEFPLMQFVTADEPFISPDILHDERSDSALVDFADQIGCRSVAVLPITAGDEWLGVVMAGSSEEAYFDEHKLHLYRNLAEQGAGALRTARLQDEVRASVARFEGFADATEYGFGMADLEGNVVYANTSLSKLLGETSPEAMIGNSLLKYYPPEAQEKLDSDVLPTVMSKGQWRGELELQAVDGQRTPVEENYFLIRGGDGQPRYIADIITDITARKEAQAELERLGLAIEEAADGVATANLEGVVEFANPAWAEMHGYTVEEVVGQHLSIFHTEEQLQNEVLPFNEQAMAKGYHEGEMGHMRKDGTTFPTQMSVAVIKDEEGKPSGLVATARDITERKQAEEAVRAARDQAQTYLDVAGTIIVAMDDQGDVTLLNEKGFEVLGYEEEEVIGQNWFDLTIPGEISDDVKAVFQKIMAGEMEQAEYYENEIITKDGERRIVAWHNSLLRDEDGNTIGVLSSGEDITERKQAEAEREEQRALLDSILSSLPVGVWVADKEFNVLLTNEYQQDMMGRQIVQEGGEAIVERYDVINLETGKMYDESKLPIVQTMSDGEPHMADDMGIRWPDGKTVPVMTTTGPLVDAEGNRVGTVAITQDITERKQAEAERERFTTRLETAAEISEQVGSILDPDELLETVIPLIKEEFGLYYVHVYTLDEESRMLDLRAGYGEAGEKMLAEGHAIPLDREASLVATAARTEEPVLVDDVTKDPNFMPNPLLPDTKTEVAVPAIAGGEVMGVFDVQHDEKHYFTEADLDVFQTLASQIANAFRSARLLEQMEVSEQRFRGLYESSPLGIALNDYETGDYLEANEALLDMVGYTLKELNELSYWDLTPEKYSEQEQEMIRLMEETGRYGPYEKEYIHKNGDVIPVVLNGVVVTDQTGRKLIWSTVEDITERKEAERDLQLTRASVENAGDAFFWFDADAKFTDVSDTTCQVLGYSREELLDMYVFDIDPVFPEAAWPNLREQVKEEGSATLESQHRTKDGHQFPVQVTVSYLEFAGEEIFFAAAKDITERKEAQAELERLGLAMEQAADGVATANLEGVVEFANPAWAEMHGYTVEEVVGQHLSIFHTEEQLQNEVLPFNEQAMAKGYHEGEMGHMRKDGTTFPTQMSVAVIKDEEGKPSGLVATARDITERKQIEQAVRTERDRAQTYLDVAGTIIVALNDQGNVTLLNKAGLEVLGYKEEEVIGQNWFDLTVPEEISEDVKAVFQKIMAGEIEQAEYYENEIITKDGDVRIVAWHNSLLRDSEGNITGVLSSGEDITEAKQAERERERFTTRLETAAEISEQVGSILDPDELLEAVIPLIKEEFGLYYVHVYTLDEESRMLNLRAGYGEAGEKMLAEGHAIPLDREASLVATAARTKEPVLVDDVTKDPNFMPNPLLPDTKTEVAVPAIAGGEVMGVFDVQHDEKHYFTEADLDVFQTLAGQIANALRSAELFDHVEASLQETEVRFRVSQALAGTETEREVWDAMLAQSAIYPQAGVGLYTIEEEDGEQVMITQAFGSFDTELAEEPIGTRFPANEFEAVKFLLSGEPFVTDNVFADERLGAAMKEDARKLGYVSLAAVPITQGDAVVGVIAAHSPEEAYFDDVKLNLYATLAEQGAVALRAARLREAIRESQVKFQTVADYTYDWETWLGPNEEYIYVSPASERITGYTPQELMEEPKLFVKMAHPDDREIVESHMHEHKSTIETASLEYRIITKDGEERWIGHACQPVYDDNGNWLGRRGSNRNITEAKRREILLEKQSAALADLTASETVYSGDLKAALKEITETAAQTLDIKRASVWLYDTTHTKIECVDLYEQGEGHSDGTELSEENFPGYFEALAQERVIAANDAHSHPHTREFSEPYLTPLGINSMLDVPIRLAGEMVGVVCNEHVGPAREWTLEEQAFATSIADFVASAMEAQERQQFTTQLRTAADLAGDVNAILDPEKLLPEVVNELQERFDLYHVHIYTLDQPSIDVLETVGVDDASRMLSQRELVMRAGSGEVGQQLLEQGHSISLDAKSLVARAARRSKVVSVADTKLDSDFMPNPLLPDTRSEVAVPLIAGDEVLGVLDVQDSQPGRFTEADLDVLTTLAGQIGIALQNASLFEEVQVATQQLREADQRKSEFLADMSHELRTPLNSIIGYAELMLMGISEMDPDTLEDVQAIYDNGRHLLKIINNILDLSKIEAGRLELNIEEVHVPSLIEEIKVSSAGLLVDKEKPVEMRTEVDEEVPSIEADRVRLSQILNNLVGNAIKFTEEGSITLRAYAEDGWVYMEVEDTGPGMSEKDLQEIFERFRRIEDSFTRRAEGTGLGLSITRYLVDMHGGTIDVDSEIGEGSTFTVRLPVQHPETDVDTEADI